MDDRERFKKDWTSYSGVKLTMTNEEALEFFADFQICKNCHQRKTDHLDERCLYGPGKWEIDPKLSVEEET